MLFDGLGGDSNDFGEFPGRIGGVIFEQSEDFLPTYSSFLTTFSVFLTTFCKLFNLPEVFKKVR